MFLSKGLGLGTLQGCGLALAPTHSQPSGVDDLPGGLCPRPGLPGLDVGDTGSAPTWVLPLPNSLPLKPSQPQAGELSMFPKDIVCLELSSPKALACTSRPLNESPEPQPGSQGGQPLWGPHSAIPTGPSAPQSGR